MADYAVWLCTPTGQRVALMDRFERLQLTISVNQVGLAKLNVPFSFPLEQYVQEDTRLEIWRQVAGGQKYIEGETAWHVRDWEHILAQRGSETRPIMAYSANEILDRPIVAYAAGSSQANKNDFIDDMMKAMVRENLGSLATDTDRNKGSYLTVAPDVSAGPESSKTMAWRNMLATLREMAQDADNKNNPVFFGVIYDPASAGFIFETRTGQWGIDHSQDSGRLVLSARNGTLSAATRSIKTSSERNYIYVGGGGQGATRTIVEVEDAARIALSPFNRRELFVDARNTTDADELGAEGQTALKAYRIKESFSVTVRDTQAVRYGREYGFGDRVLVELGNRLAAARLDAVEIVVENGKDDVKPVLRIDE